MYFYTDWWLKLPFVCQITVAEINILIVILQTFSSTSSNRHALNAAKQMISTVWAIMRPLGGILLCVILHLLAVARLSPNGKNTPLALSNNFLFIWRNHGGECFNWIFWEVNYNEATLERCLWSNITWPKARCLICLRYVLSLLSCRICSICLKITVLEVLNQSRNMHCLLYRV